MRNLTLVNKQELYCTMEVNLNGLQLEVGETYKCVANDIVNQWEVNLTYLGDGQWSHPQHNIDGSYPPIVHEVLELTERNDCTISAPCGQCIACDLETTLLNNCT